MPMSGNVGDTLNVMPVLSGIYKSTGHAISLVLQNKMKIFNGIKDFLLMQDCISSVKFISDVKLDSTYNVILPNENFTRHETRPWETVRLDEYFKQHYKIDYEVDDDFMFNVPDCKPSEKFLVGDRMFHSDMDQRRRFNVLQESGKFNLDRFEFIDYNRPMHENAAIIKSTKKTIVSTFTGISVIADLLKKDTIILWGDELKNWDNKPIEYSFNKHFYRDRSCRLMYLNDFCDEVLNEN